MSIKRNVDGKIIAKKFTLRQIECASEDMGGYCIACGAEAYGVEPDARRYRCEACDHKSVYGAEELVMMGLVK